MASLSISVSDTTLDDEQVATVTLSASALAAAVPPKTEEVTLGGKATLNDGTVIETTEDVTLSVTKPGVPAQSVSFYELEVVSGDPDVLKGVVQGPNGTFTFTGEADV